MAVEVRRFDVFLVNLDPTVGSEIKKTRPCVAISPDDLNRYLRTVIVAPLTTTVRNFPPRVRCLFQGRHGEVVLDQIRTVDKQRLLKNLGTIGRQTQTKILSTLSELFAP